MVMVSRSKGRWGLGRRRAWLSKHTIVPALGLPRDLCIVHTHLRREEKGRGGEWRAGQLGSKRDRGGKGCLTMGPASARVWSI